MHLTCTVLLPWVIGVELYHKVEDPSLVQCTLGSENVSMPFHEIIHERFHRDVAKFTRVVDGLDKELSYQLWSEYQSVKYLNFNYEYN